MGITKVAVAEVLEVDFFTNKLMRVSRYFDMLTSSFSIIQDGMDVEQYNKFRHTLTPASGFRVHNTGKLSLLQQN